MRRAGQIQAHIEWDLEETEGHAEEKVSIELKTKLTNNNILLEVLICLEREAIEQIPKDHCQYQTNLSTRFVGKLRQRHYYAEDFEKHVFAQNVPALNKMSSTAKSFWWKRMSKNILHT